ncbi:MazG family protein [Cellulomonas sp. NPDC089187]|uniref:MazG family protein n=1 Tax=Cellulomonas sp. NPDC089187 TaxID=3154970 RepID=UPI00341D5176
MTTDQAAPDPLRDVVAVMDRLRQGCRWNAEQTHATLVPYLIEEAHEVAEAVDHDDRDNLREELGDLLLQVLFHARIAQEHPTDPWDIDDVAAALSEKLIRRNPHVFGDAVADDIDAIHRQWEERKQAEKARGSVFEGIPLGLSALARAQKVTARAARNGIAAPLPTDDSLGSRLLALVAEAHATGLDAEGELRRAARAWEDRLSAAESAG